MKKPKKFKAKPFRAWLDALASACVKARDKRICQMSGIVISNPYNCQWCHIKSRKGNNVRWLLDNALCLSGESHSWGHANPADFEHWFIKKYPERWEVIMTALKKPITTWKQWDYEEVEAYLIKQAKLHKVKPENLPVNFRAKFIKKLKELS